MRPSRRFSARAATAGIAALALIASNAATGVAFAGPAATPSTAGSAQHFTLYDGSKVTLGADGLGVRTDARGKHPRTFMTMPQQKTSVGGRPRPSRDDLIRRLSVPQHTGATGDVLVELSTATFDGRAVGHGRRAAHTTDTRVNTSLRAIGASTATPLFAMLPPNAQAALRSSAPSQFGAVDPARLYLVHIGHAPAAQAAAKLRRTPGVSYAAPDRYVSTSNTDPVPLPGWAKSGATHPNTSTTANGLPPNYGLQSSLQGYLNAGGVNLAGGYSDITNRLHALPGHGEIITNVSLGDLTDQAMAENGDPYVSFFGPTTVVENGQRYLDYPSLPKIPTYTVDPSGAVDPLGSVEGVDPALGEVLLDFSVMAPLPHDQQRPANMGDGPTDLLGIAPGAQYRLVEPKQPTFANIATAMLAAAQQTPRPDVITASLGFGTDTVGFPGRYLEDDPLMRSVVSTIVNRYGIAVTISSNDGTRLFTPAGVGPDGGSTPTELPWHGEDATSIDDDGQTTTPSVVPDSGAIDVGGTTTDDTLAVPPQAGGPLSRTGTFAETRLNGMAAFSSGFGTRVNVSAPSDNIPALTHCGPNDLGCPSSGVRVSLSGGTSASAPMTAAVAADLLQVGKATGHPLTPQAVRQVLAETGRAVTTQPQVDRQLQVGPQIDITRAVEKLFGDSHGTPSIVRLSTAHRVSVLGSANANFVTNTDPGAIDLAGPPDDTGEPSGESFLGPLTFGVDATGLPEDGPLDYVLRVGSKEFHSATPSIRVLPAEVLVAAGRSVVSTTNRSVPVSVQIRRGHDVLAQTGETLTFGPTDGTHESAQAPVVAPVTPIGRPVQVHYDISDVPAAHLNAPELIISSISHWSPYAAPFYRIAYSVPLTSPTGTVTVPASAFSAGGGVYGATVLQDSSLFQGGAAVPFRIAGGSPSDRPDAPTLASAATPFGHQAVATRATATLRVNWDARSVAGATGAALEFSAPGPTLYNMLNTFTNQYGTTRDDNGGDSPSTALVTLPNPSGTTGLDLLKLGIPTSLNYGVRVLATKQGRVIGQASPSSWLEFDDGLTPDGGQVVDFDIDPHAASTVATATTGDQGLTGSSLSGYAPATGHYGPAFAHDGSGQNLYFLYGSDPGNHRLLATSYPWGGGTQQHVLTYDTTDQLQVSDNAVDVASQYNILTGRVDAQRHRADLLAWRGGDQADVVLPVDTATGTFGSPVTADNSTPNPKFYTMLDVQQATGKVDLAGTLAGGICVLRRKTGFTTVDMDAGTAAPPSTVGVCPDGLASDQSGHALLTLGPLPEFKNSISPGGIQQVDEASGAVGNVPNPGAFTPMFPTVDTKHGLLVVGFLGGTDYQVNNNAMSGLGVYDLRTGARLSFTEHLNLINALNGPGVITALQNKRGIQIDPETRTGWTYSPYGNQVQRFSY